MVIWEYAGLQSFTTTQVEDNNIKSIIHNVKHLLRSGVGYRSKLLLCHPDNRDMLGKLIRETTDRTPDIFVPFPYRIVTNGDIPKSQLRPTGKIEWLSNNFFSYASGPSDPTITTQEYQSMCEYFGWARKEYKEHSLFYELDDPSFKFFTNQLNDIINSSPQFKVSTKMDWASIRPTNFIYTDCS